jgi:hypothetical protein
MSDVRDGIAACQTVRVTVPEAPAEALAGTGAWQARGACPRSASLAARRSAKHTAGHLAVPGFRITAAGPLSTRLTS